MQHVILEVLPGFRLTQGCRLYRIHTTTTTHPATQPESKAKARLTKPLCVYACINKSFFWDTAFTSFMSPTLTLSYLLQHTNTRTIYIHLVPLIVMSDRVTNKYPAKLWLIANLQGVGNTIEFIKDPWLIVTNISGHYGSQYRATGL